MPDSNVIVKEGVVLEALPNTMFRVQLDEKDASGNQRTVLTMLSGKLRRYFIKIMPGDRVRMEFSPSDLNLGRIVYRMK